MALSTDFSVAWLEGPHPLDQTALTRTEVVKPGMCGHNSLLVGQIGDWTWDAVTIMGGVDVLQARNPAGAPTYLSFYYYRIRGSRRFHLRTPTFGDRLDVTSRVFDFGSESVLTLHRIARTPAGEPLRRRGAADHYEADEFYRFEDDDCLYIENFNRWISRGDDPSNRYLVKSSPVGFQHRHLPKLADAYSPRYLCRQARTRLTFRDEGADLPAGPELRVEYRVDPSRDLNAVGLLYFAAYFSIVDWALLRLWRQLGRTDRSFLERVVVDQQLCYLGNADADGVVAATVRRWLAPGDDGREIVDVVLRDRNDDRLIAVCTLQILSDGS
jgi:probable biosynthetic protein (TIGR04098 family)